MRCRIDNPRAVQLARRAHKLALLVRDGLRMVCREMDERPVEVAQLHHGITQAEPSDDFLPHRRRGGRGQSKADRCADRLGLCSEHHVVGAEVVTPLADQVRFIDGEQTGPSAPQRFAGLPIGQLLRREKDERAGIAGGEKSRRARTSRLLRVEDDSRHAGGAQVGELVILQRDQRRNDDRRPRPHQPRQLVDRRFPAASGQYGQYIAAADERLGRA